MTRIQISPLFDRYSVVSVQGKRKKKSWVYSRITSLETSKGGCLEKCGGVYAHTETQTNTHVYIMYVHLVYVKHIRI